jgi:hypothetical protein
LSICTAGCTVEHIGQNLKGESFIPKADGRSPENLPRRPFCPQHSQNETDAQTLSQLSCHAPHADVLQSPTHLRAVQGRHSVLEPNVGGGSLMARTKLPDPRKLGGGGAEQKAQSSHGSGPQLRCDPARPRQQDGSGPRAPLSSTTNVKNARLSQLRLELNLPIYFVFNVFFWIAFEMVWACSGLKLGAHLAARFRAHTSTEMVKLCFPQAQNR